MLHAREAGPQLVERLLHAARDLERVGTRQLLDDEQQAGAAVHDRVADQRLVVLDHVRDVAEPHGRRQLGAAPPPVPSSGTRARCSGVTRGRTWRTWSRWLAVSMKPPVPGRRGLEEAERRDELRVAGRPDDPVQRDVLVAQALGVDEHLQLPVALAEDGHVGDALDAEQARADRPAREHRGLDLRHALAARGRSSACGSAEDSGCSIWGGCDTFGFACACVSCSWTSWRASRMVGAGLEEQDDRRHARDGLRAQDRRALGAVEQVGLERDRDELLDLLGGEPERLRLHLDVGRRELGEHVGRRLVELQDAEDHDARGDADDEQPEAQAPADDVTDHGRPLRRPAGGARGPARAWRSWTVSASSCPPRW